MKSSGALLCLLTLNSITVFDTSDNSSKQGEVYTPLALGIKKPLTCGGGLAQMVERSLSMREVPGSIPGSSKCFSFFSFPSLCETDC